MDALKRDLPNFPDEVSTDWLLPYAKSEGWPPLKDEDGMPMKRWRYLLGMRPLRFYRSLSWTLENRSLVPDTLADGEVGKINGLLRAGLLGEQNEYSAISNSRERLTSILQYTLAHGRLPKAPALIQEASGLRIMDGNHRIAVYVYLTGFGGHFTPQYPLEPRQDFWIATPAATGS
ncbi:hypothetical protein [Cupriavidus alkaliphilus]|uniref:hypothetical protein n=1 Tax=Cupriavidus alkaliphilus TaxID=942866 RepID=UPI000815AFB6|nr:hypothetical protein [Cupriavidus alkaliphilus]SCB24421.1 hypothetical protein GA0116996_10776 [Cupriavidus alkaliphilus]